MGAVVIFIYHAGVAQLIERFLAMEEVQGLSPCTRTIKDPLLEDLFGSNAPSHV